MSWIGKQINSRQEIDVQKKHLKNSLNEMEWDVNTWRSQNGSNVHIYMCMLIDSLRCINVKIEIIQHLIFQRDVIHASLRYFNRKCSTVNKFSVAFLISHKIFVRRTEKAWQKRVVSNLFGCIIWIYSKVSLISFHVHVEFPALLALPRLHTHLAGSLMKIVQLRWMAPVIIYFPNWTPNSCLLHDSNVMQCNATDGRYSSGAVTRAQRCVGIIRESINIKWHLGENVRIKL